MDPPIAPTPVERLVVTIAALARISPDLYAQGKVRLAAIAVELEREASAELQRVLAGEAGSGEFRRVDNVRRGTKRWLTSSQAAQLLGITDRAVRKRCAVGRFETAWEDGGRWLIDEEEVRHEATKRGSSGPPGRGPADSAA